MYNYENKNINIKIKKFANMVDKLIYMSIISIVRIKNSYRLDDNTIVKRREEKNYEDDKRGKNDNVRELYDKSSYN